MTKEQKNIWLNDRASKLRDYINNKVFAGEFTSYEWHRELMFQFVGRAYKFYQKLNELEQVNPDCFNIMMDEFPAMSRDGLDITLTSMTSITSLVLLELAEQYLAKFCALSGIEFELIDIYKLENFFNHNEHQIEIMERTYKLIDQFLDYPEYDKKTMFFLKLGEIIFPTLTKDASNSDLTLKITALELIWEEAKTIKDFSLSDLEKSYLKMEQDLPDDDPRFRKEWTKINQKLDDISTELNSVAQILKELKNGL